MRAFSLPRFFFLAILPSLGLGLASLFFLFLDSRYYVKPNVEYIVYYASDIVISLVVIILTLFFLKDDCNKLKILVNNYYNKPLSKYTVFYMAITSYTIYQAFLFFKGFSISSASLLISENRDGGYFSLLIKRLLEVILVFLFLGDGFKSNKINVFILFLGFCGLVLDGLSRSEVVIFAWMCIIYLSFFSDVKISTALKLLSVFILISITIAGFVTILQGRSDGFFIALYSSVESMFRYRIYTIYLSEHIATLPLDINKYLFPFFGFLGERFSLLFSNFDNLISSNGSFFISEFIKLKNGDLANALYPWWGWFVYAYGPIGILYKALFSSLFLFVFIKLRFPITTLYILYLLVIKQFQRHPLINATDFYGFMGVLVFEVILIFFSSELLSKYCFKVNK